jgi:dipeptidyl aminopeptidase/acylaminoacyl peptidase
VDTNSVIIIGHGVGGFISTMALAQSDEQVFKCGVAISPITEWTRHGKVIMLFVLTVENNISLKKPA